MTNSDKPSQNFLLDFASFGNAIRIILLAEIVAIIVTIGRNSSFDQQAWQDLNLLSAFALILSFCTVAALKLVSPLVSRMSIQAGAIVVFLMLLLVAIIGTEAMIFSLYDLELIEQRWPEWREPLLLRSLMITAIIGIPGLRYLIMAHRAVVDAKSQQDAKMQALQSRIRPHFLFNSLNSIASLTRTDPDKAEEILHDLADLFRVLLADARKLVPMSTEREISRQYLEIEKVRLGDHIKVQWNVGTIPRAAQIPALTLQPLLENAIYHGIETRLGGGTLKIDLWAEGETLNIMISNPLPDPSNKTHTKGNKIALDNIRQRLETQFGNAASMESFEEGGQYHVRIKMPIVRG
ncbi:MAG: histidine kinase [Gammaproteobacteria bacterium]|nr:MAG: histidine kinase [Gammaproteobacteria bacterium]